MTQKVSDEKLGEFARRQNDWFRRVREGVLDPDEVAQAVKQIIDRSPLLPNQLELVTFLLEGEVYVASEELVKRAKKMGANLGERQAKCLFEHQGEIPEEWRQYYLFFPGDICKDRNGSPSFACLVWYDDRKHWLLDYIAIGGGYDSVVRLLRPRK